MRVLRSIGHGITATARVYGRLLRRIGWRGAVPVVIVTVLLAFWLGAVVLGAMDDLPGNTYSRGWRMGQLTRYAMQGNPVFKTGEAEILLGNNSSAGQVLHGSKVIFDNPGHLSSSRAVQAEYRPLVGQSVALRYRQVKVQLTRVEGDTDYRIEEMVPLDPSLAPDSCGNPDDGRSSTRGDGDRAGFVVKVSRKGNLFKSWEIVMQNGNASGSFVDMSVKDSEIADCALRFLKSGVQAKVRYAQSLIRDPLTSDTTLTVLGISRVP